MPSTENDNRKRSAGIEYAPTRQSNAIASTSGFSDFWSRPTPEFVPAASNHNHDSDSNHSGEEAAKESRLKWSVGWSTVSTNDTDSAGWTGPGEMRHTTQYGAWVEFRFNGSAIEVIVPPSAPHHTLYVVLDHDAIREDHNGACSAKTPCPESVRWRAKGLGRTEHVVRIENFYAGKEVRRALDLSGFSVYPHRPTILGIPISPSTATLFLLVALLAFLHGLFLYVRRRNNRKVLQRRREMGLDSRCDSYGYPFGPEDALLEEGGGSSDLEEHWRILEDMSRAALGGGQGARRSYDDDGSSSDEDDDEILGEGGERRSGERRGLLSSVDRRRMLTGTRVETRGRRGTVPRPVPVELGLGEEQVKGNGESEVGEEFFRPLEDPPPRYSAE